MGCSLGSVGCKSAKVKGLFWHVDGLAIGFRVYGLGFRVCSLGFRV